jgi:hypothetical protein
MLDWDRDCGIFDIYGTSHRAEISMKKPRLFKCARLIVYYQRQGVICIYMQEEPEMLIMKHSETLFPSLTSNVGMYF